MPAVPVTFCLVMSAGAGVPGKMKSSVAGILSKAETLRFKFLESTSFCASVNWRTIKHSIRHTAYRIMSEYF